MKFLRSVEIERNLQRSFGIILHMSTRIWPVRLGCALIVLLTSGFVLRSADRPDAPVIVEEIVAKINGDIVTRGDMEKRLTRTPKRR